MSCQCGLEVHRRNCQDYERKITRAGIYLYDRDYIPEIIEKILYDKWMKWAPSFFDYEKRIGPNLVELKSEVGNLSGTIWFSNKESVDEIDSVRGKIDFEIHYGRWNESLNIIPKYVSYGSYRIHMYETKTKLLFSGLTQGLWKFEKEQIPLYEIRPYQNYQNLHGIDMKFLRKEIQERLFYTPEWAKNTSNLIFKTCKYEHCHSRFVTWTDEHEFCANYCKEEYNFDKNRGVMYE